MSFEEVICVCHYQVIPWLDPISFIALAGTNRLVRNLCIPYSERAVRYQKAEYALMNSWTAPQKYGYTPYNPESDEAYARSFSQIRREHDGKPGPLSAYQAVFVWIPEGMRIMNGKVTTYMTGRAFRNYERARNGGYELLYYSSIGKASAFIQWSLENCSTAGFWCAHLGFLDQMPTFKAQRMSRNLELSFDNIPMEYLKPLIRKLSMILLSRESFYSDQFLHRWFMILSDVMEAAAEDAPPHDTHPRVCSKFLHRGGPGGESQKYGCLREGQEAHDLYGRVRIDLGDTYGVDAWSAKLDRV